MVDDIVVYTITNQREPFLSTFAASLGLSLATIYPHPPMPADIVGTQQRKPRSRYQVVEYECGLTTFKDSIQALEVCNFHCAFQQTFPSHQPCLESGE